MDEDERFGAFVRGVLTAVTLLFLAWALTYAVR